MLNSATKILSHYLPGEVYRSHIYSIDVERSENPEDFYYLCLVKGTWFVVYETDYVVSLPHVLKEIIEVFRSDGLRPLHWLGKKDTQGKTTTLPLAATEDRSLLPKLMFDSSDGPYRLRYAVLAVEMPKSDYRRYDPNVYGGAK